MLPDALLQPLEQLLNALIAARSRSRHECAALDGRTVAVAWRELGLTLHFTARGESLEVRGEGEAQATIRGTLPAFGRALVGEHHGAPPGITVEGDAVLARDFQRLLSSLEVDWEEQVARLTGDAMARRLGNLARGLTGWGRYASDRLAHDVVEYLQRETRDLPHRAEVDLFLKGVDQTRDDVERLAARLARASAALGGQS
jgi:ubiquinone biosynthesis protein UbiJ